MEQYWHRAADKLWHLYSMQGESRCGLRALIGLGLPPDATHRLPRSIKRVCKTCKEAAEQ